MPWKVSHQVNERMRFVIRLEEGERMTDLCREFGISRKTGYKFLQRFRDWGPRGLFDDTRKPIHSPQATKAAIVALIVDTKRQKPTWGASKIRAYLLVKYPKVSLPSIVTTHMYLDRAGLVKRQRKRRGITSMASPKLATSKSASELWCADFKGQFQLGNRQYCYPLTITDHFSRFLISCEGLENTNTQSAMCVFEAAFREFGIPERIRTDNGTPFSSNALFGLSRLNVWWLKLGIKLERTDPGCPQQNGRHERMHRTLKAETTRPAGNNLLDQQQRFDEFTREYNQIRPHQALGMKTPASLFESSKKPFPLVLMEPDYRLHDFTRRVYPNGNVYLKNNSQTFHLSSALTGERVGFAEDEEGIWRISFLTMDLGFYDERKRIFSPVEKLVL